MKNPLRTEGATSAGLLLARVPVGAFFLLAGYAKVFKMGVAQFVADNIDKVPRSMPPWFGSNYLHAVPYAEMAIGLMLILGFVTRLAGFIASFMLISFTVAVTGILDPRLPFSPNLIYLGVVLMVFLAGPGKFSLDGFLWGRKGRKAFAD